MSKSNRMYKIFMTSMIVIIAGLLLATGIIAIQKSMKMNLSFEANPNYLFEVYIQKSGDDTKKLVFRNYEKSASEGVVMENGFSTLYGNTLTADDTFLETYGGDFEFIIENHTKNSGMRVSVTANSETEGGHEGVLPTITEDKMTATKLKDGFTADYIRFGVTTTEVVFPQTTELNIVFSEYNEYAVGVSPSSGNFTYTANPVAISGENYTANIKAKTGYSLEITVTRDDGTTTPLIAGQGKDYVWDSSTGALTIYASAVTGDITINCLNDNAIPYAISYTLNGGSVEPANPTAYTIESDSFTLTNPTKTGYTFAGWTGSNGTTAQTSVTIAKGSTGARSYTATWTVVEYTISYTLNGGTNNANNPEEYTIESANITLQAPTKSGYSFTGWTGSNGTTAQTSVTIAKGSTGNKSYTANWSANSYTVTLNNQSATTAGTTSVSATYGSAMPSITKPTKTGYTFGGYYTSTNGEGTQYYTATGASAKNYDKASTLTLYAKWTLTTYYVYATINGTTYNTTDKAIATYTMSPSSQPVELNCKKANSAFTATGDAISTTKGSVSGTILTIPANTTGDITVTPLGYTILKYGASGAVAAPNTGWTDYHYIVFNGAENYSDSGTNRAQRWIIIGAGSSKQSSYLTSSQVPSTAKTQSNSELSANYVLLLSEVVLESTYFDKSDQNGYDGTQNANWSTSTLDYWLNDTYWTASGLSNYTSKIIAQNSLVSAWTTTTDSSGITTNTTANNTAYDHKMFLLASKYGYVSSSGTTPEASGDARNYTQYTADQKFTAEDYLGSYNRSTGASSNPRLFSFSGASSSSWWLRSGCYNSSNNAYNVRNGGTVNRNSVDGSSRGVRPCFVFNLA